MSVALAGARQPTVSRSSSGPAVASPQHLSPHERSTAIRIVGGSAVRQPAPLKPDASERGLKHRAPPESSAAAVEVEAEDDAAIATPPTIEDGPPPAVDEAAESAFLADARERGEAVPRRSAAEIEEETNGKKPLPPLDELVNRIPADVREVLEDLFRARFVAVKRFPKKALKSGK